MKLVVQVKLLPTPVQAAALEATLRACNEAATWASEIAFANDVKRNFALREHTYGETCDAYATLSGNPRAGNLGKPGSNRYRKATQKPIVFLLATLTLYRKGESDLVRRDSGWFLSATCEVPEVPRNADPVDVLGIDLGIVNIASTSDGEIMAGRDLNRMRVRERKLRAKLQKKNTPSAKRRLKKRRRKEARRVKDINHKIAKHVVAEAERTGRGIALEDLTGIRERVRLRKPQRATLHSWAFHQLGRFIACKARRAGVPVVYVDPAYTSRTCAECGHVDRANRVSQAWFACRSCGFVDHADRNGSRNIRARAWELWRRGAESTAPAPPPAVRRPGRGWTQTQHHRQ
ncbi:transposase [Streptomyces sp. NBC_00457]|uniref:RNA-guided endonuclease InsQ/TnpB family protein n=1 Tax=Streptomyces sp. NBC_00457 TaxID=2975748 RepID=UPI002E2201DE